MSTSDDLRKQLEELQALVAEAKKNIAPIEESKQKLSQEENEAYRIYQETVARIRAEKMEIDNNAFEMRKKINELEQETAVKQRDLQHQIKVEEEERRREEEELANLVLIEKWDKLTAAATWREWAKEHQIDAAHKIVMDRSVILADVMGLGKTLSSIITCDIAQAATKFASKNFPFLGEEIDQYCYAGYYDPQDQYHNVPGYWTTDQQDTYIANNNLTYKDAYTKKVVVNAIERPVGKRILYFCPSPMIRNVQAEFRMWAKHRSVTFIGGMSKSEREFIFEHVLAERNEFVVICNYEAWRRDKSIIEELINLKFDTVIIDEAHIVKELKSQAYRGVKQIIDEGKPEYVIPMTGTPILNRPQELFALLTLVNPKSFYKLQDFLWDYCDQDDDGFWRFKAGGLDRIAKQINKNFLRRTKDQAGIVLPPKTVNIHTLQVDVDAYPNQARIREQMRKNAFIQVTKNEETKAIGAAAMIAVFTRLRQIETWPAGIKQIDPITKEVILEVDVEESQKLDYLISPNAEGGVWEGLIPEVIEDERCVVFSQFKAPLRELRDRIERMGRRAVILDGETPSHQLDEIREDFDQRYTPSREDSKWDVVLCNYRVGGVGMNMTAATQMFILDEEWNPGKRDQAYDRIHRMGQDKPVTVHVLRNEKTIDDWLAGIMDKKEGLVDGFNNTMISFDEFKDFLDNGGLM